MTFDPYQVLDLTPTATQSEVKQAYRRLAKQFHPDSHNAAANHERIAQINAAYEVLKDAQQHRPYTRKPPGSNRQNTRTRQDAPRSSSTRVSRDIDTHIDRWLKQVYTPVYRRLGKIISQLKPEITQLAADPFDDQLMEGFQDYLENCRTSLDTAQTSFRSMPNPANVASIAASLYHCLSHLEDGIEELERFTMCYDDHYLNTGRELFRLSAKLRREAQAELKSVL